MLLSSSKYMNKSMLIGRLTASPELKKTPSDKSVTSFTLAVNRKYKNQDGEKSTDFISVVSWGKQAEFLVSYAKKGSLISVEGEIRTRSYTDKKGEKRYLTEVLCTSFEILESRAAQALRENNFDSIDVDLAEEELPF
jgi:single stranded DNA-binding protein (ssb)